MILKEEDAVLRWCPFVRLLNGGSNMRGHVDTKCIGSDCMMWRWAPEEFNQDGEATGYCGLAGEP